MGQHWILGERSAKLIQWWWKADWIVWRAVPKRFLLGFVYLYLRQLMRICMLGLIRWWHEETPKRTWAFSEWIFLIFDCFLFLLLSRSVHSIGLDKPLGVLDFVVWSCPSEWTRISPGSPFETPKLHPKITCYLVIATLLCIQGVSSMNMTILGEISRR